MAEKDKILKKSLELLDEYLSQNSPEELQKLMDEISGPDSNLKGWVDIEEELPMVTCGDVLENNALVKFVKVKNTKEEEWESQVGDHNTWYYHAKEAGITHWWKD